MGITERKERERVKMRNLILATSTELFKSGGIENISIRNIAGKIEYSPATIYLYYKDKEEIIHNLRENFVDDFLSKLMEFGFIKDHFSRLKNFTQSWIEFAILNPEKYDLIFMNSKPFTDDRIFTHLYDLTSECMNVQLIQRMPKTEAATMILSYLHGTSMLSLRGKFELKSRRELIEYATALSNRFLSNMKGPVI